MKKLLAYILVAALMVSFVPFSAFAGGNVSSISYQTAYTDFVENADGEWDDRDNYFRYHCNFHEGDQLTVNYAAGGSKVFTAEFLYGELYFTAEGEDPILQWVDIFTSSNQNESHWTVGGTYNYYVEYAGCRTAVTVHIVANPVAAIEYVPRREHVMYENGEGYFRDDGTGTGSSYFYYHCQRRDSGDKLIVIGTDSSRREYTFNFDEATHEWSYISEDNDVIPDRDIHTFDNQDEKHFTLGSDNSFGIEYMGKVAYIPVTIIKNPITDISYSPAGGQKTIYEYTHGEWRTDEHGEQYYEYHSPGFDIGDVLNVTYADSGETIRYEFRTVNGEYSQSTGFFDDGNNQLPEGDLYSSIEGDWFYGSSDSVMIVTYMGKKSAPAPVLIIQNPVKAIRFERAQQVEIVENTNMWYDSTDDRYYYNIPYHQTGDKLIIIDNEDNETVYDYQVNGAYTAPGKEDIPSFDVYFNSDQHNNPWQLGDNEYTVEYFGCTYALTATIIENTVVSIEYVRAEPYQTYENAGGYYDDMYGFYKYSYPWRREGDKLIVNDSVKGRIEYECKIIDEEYYELAFVDSTGKQIDEYDVNFVDNQEDNHWHVGSDNEYYVEYLGARCTLYATVLENPVKAIRFSPVKEPTVMVGVRSYVDYYTGVEIFYEPDFKVGDKLTVIDKNNKEKVYTARRDEEEWMVFEAADGEKLNNEYLRTNSKQHITPWAVGDNNEYFVEYLGATCPVMCTVLDNPVESIEFVPQTVTKYMEGTNMYYDEWIDTYFYELPGINEGDCLAVNYNDGRGRVEYVAQFDNSINEMTFVSAAYPPIVVDELFEWYDEQYIEPWEVGEHHWTLSYCGKETQVLIVITENNIAGISYTPVRMPQVWSSDYSIEVDEETGREFKRYNIPYFEEGDTLTIQYKDGTSKDFVLTFDESDGEHYFVNGDEKFHMYTLMQFDNQNSREWSLGRGNYYSVDFYGHTTDIEVEVIATDVKSIKFNPVEEIVLDENVDGEYVFDDQGNKFYFYNHVRIVNVGDSLTVTYIDNREVTYYLYEDATNERWGLRAANGDEIDTSEIDIDDHQWEKHWKVGKKNYFDIKYHGATDTVQVTIKGDYVPGDINGDYEVDNKDLIRLFQYLSEWGVEVNDAALDVNGDQAVDNKDLIRLFQYLSEWGVDIF